MKTVLLFGDSNTWGYNPVTRERYPAETRWAGVVRARLAPDWHVIEEGLNGRTTVFEDPLDPGRNGRTYLVPCLASHRPLDVVCIMLGTNDCKPRFAAPAYDIANGMGRLVEIVQASAAGREGGAPAVVLMCPPPFAPLAGTRFADEFAGGEEKSRALAAQYRRVADELGCAFVDAGEVIVSSTVDAIHLDADQQVALGEHMAAYLRGL